jgi:U3 small nucleolar RNA-associated protein 7
MATAGLDGQLKVWDIRTYKPVHEYYTPTPAQSLSISQQGLLAVAHGPRVSVWKDALRTKQTSPYMTHLQPSSMITDLQFVPFEDVLGVGHGKGISSLIVPGAGEANFDSLEANPYEVKAQRREGEVRKLLEKLQPETIALSPNFIGTVERTPGEIQSEEKEVIQGKIRRKQRGRASAHKRFMKKQSNVLDAKRDALKEAMAKRNEERDAKPKGPPTALDRFKK